MENGSENRAPEQDLDTQIDQLLSGSRSVPPPTTPVEKVAQEFARLTAEESPRMSNAARAEGLKALRQAAAQKRAARRTNPFAFLVTLPRWVQIAAVALVVVVIANGVGNALADALPGSLLYPFKRFGEGGQLLLQNTNGQRAQLWMELANTRLDEVQRLLASGTLVDPSYLDAVDESILRALSELMGTRGDERVELLKKLTQLAIRQQQVLNELAARTSSPDERARLEQSARLLDGIASYAGSPDAADPSSTPPFPQLFPVTTPLPGTPLTLTPSPTRTMSITHTVTPSSTAGGGAGISPDTLSGGADSVGQQPSVSPKPSNTDRPEPTNTRPPTRTPNPVNTPKSTSEPTDAGTAVATNTRLPSRTPEPTDSQGPSQTDEPPQTGVPSKTHEPPKTQEPPETHEPSKTHQPPETHEPSKTHEPPETHEPSKTHESSKTHEPAKTHEPSETHEPQKTHEPTKAPKTPKPTKTPHAPNGDILLYNFDIQGV